MIKKITQIIFQSFILFFFLGIGTWSLELGTLSYAQTTEQKRIHWLTWQEAIKEREKFIAENKDALNEGKILPKKFFINVYTSWCGWCKKMDASTFLEPNVVDYLNNHYYPVKMDGEMRDTIIFNNHSFVNMNPTGRGSHTLPSSLLDYKLSYPTYVILDENLSRIAIYPGYKSAEDLLGILLFFKTNQHITYNNFFEEQIKQKEQKKAGN